MTQLCKQLFERSQWKLNNKKFEELWLISVGKGELEMSLNQFLNLSYNAEKQVTSRSFFWGENGYEPNTLLPKNKLLEQRPPVTRADDGSVSSQNFII